MKRGTNLILLLAVALLVALPLGLVKREGSQSEIFQGSDEQAKALVAQISPTYKPWAKPLMEPPSGEVASLLFALQAALGAGFIGYYLGSRVTRAKLGKGEGALS